MQIKRRMFLLQSFCFLIIALEKFPVLFGCRIEWLVLKRQVDGMNFLHQSFCSFIHTGIHQFFPHVLCGKIVRMHQVFGIEPVIPQVIDHQFVGWELKQLVKLVHQVMHSRNQHSLAAVVFHHTFPQVPHRTDGKNDLQL